MKGVDNDASLVARCKRELPHKHSAFEELVNRYKDKIYTLCRRMVGNGQDAEDLMQESFLRAFVGLRNFEERAAFSSWLYSIAHNRCLEFLVKRSKDAARDVRYGMEGRQESDPDVSPTSLALENMLLRLHPEQRSVLIMKYVMDLEIPQIAATLGIGVSAVKMRLLRAREELRSLYVEQA